MKSPFQFTFSYFEQQFHAALKAGYDIITCKEYVAKKKNGLASKTLVNRVDIDFNIKKTQRMIDVFNRLGIKATFFLRLHAPEYNPFSFENYRIVRGLIESGHELGYHSEVIDQSVIWQENPTDCLLRDIDVINSIFRIKVEGVASHGGQTGLNNLDFWKDKRPQDFGLLYEGYDKQTEFNLFQEAFYISDSEWTRWKCYDKGVLVENDRRDLADHVLENRPLLYVLTHPDTYFEHNFYE